MNIPTRIVDFRHLKSIKNSVHLAVGVFDGIHLGHVSVIQRSVSSARSCNGFSVVLTFNPHPSRLFKGDLGTDLIMSLEQKSKALGYLGVDYLIAKTFDKDFSKIPSTDFLGYLVEKIPSLKSISIGENFRFGFERKGTVNTLIKSGLKLGVDVWSIDRIKHNGFPISSTRIRKYLCCGKIKEVNALLGYNYYSEGTIINGNKLGKKIGFPTMNFDWSPECKPLFGVYVVRLRISNIKNPPLNNWTIGIANYGLRPTVNKSANPKPLLEVHALEEFDIIDKNSKIIVEWLKFIRKEEQFEDVDALRNQILKDCLEAKNFFK